MTINNTAIEDLSKWFDYGTIYDRQMDRWTDGWIDRQIDLDRLRQIELDRQNQIDRYI